MNLLLVTPFFAPDFAPSSPVYAALAEHLAGKGHQVTVVTGMPYYGRGRVWEGYERKLWVREQMDGYTVIRLFVGAPEPNKRLARFVSFCLFNVLAAVLTAWLKCDVVFIPNPFFQAGLPLHCLAFFRRKPIVLSVEDIYPDVAERIASLGRWPARVIQALEESSYRRARYIRVLSEKMRDRLVAYGVPARKLAVVPNLADTEFVRPLPRHNLFRQRYRIPEQAFVVLYAGNMGLSSGLDVAIDAAGLLRDCRDLLFVLLGEGVRRTGYQETVASRRLNNVRFIPFQPREDLPWVLASADVSLVTLVPQLANESLPSKLYWVLASARPVILYASAQAAVAEVVEQAGCGVRVQSAEELADALLRLRADPAVRACMGERGRQHVIERYSRHVVCGQLESLLQQAAGSR